MNERIRELEVQCWEPRKYGPAWFDAEKFAELLVRECIEVIEDSEGYSQYFPHVAKNIKKHFGVKR